MTKGQIIGLSLGAVIVLCTTSFGLFAAGIGKEASRLDEAMKQDLSQHMAIEDVKKQLSAESFEIKGSATQIDADGPVHSFVVYSTRLTLKLDFDPQGKMMGYHLDRA